MKGDVEIDRKAPDPQQRQLETLMTEPRTKRLLASLALLNIFILLCRPQYSLPFLSWTAIPVLLSVPPLFFCLSRLPEVWRQGTPARAMFALLALGAIWVPLARNNFWALQTLRDLTQQYFCYLFPLVLLLPYGKRLRRLAVCCTVCGVYLAAYSLLHDGRGPGGYLGDENDLCMQLDGLLGIPLLLFPASRGGLSKLKKIFATAIIIGGIVASWSRGGFVGMVVVLFYMFIKTPYKVQSISVGILLFIGALICVPQSYWDEMKTISHTDEGTAKGRLDIWKVGVRIWLSPPHFLFGTGMQNNRYYLGDFEPEENKTSSGKSVAGRAVHSTYVQLLADLGLAGLLIFVYAVGSTLRRNAKTVRILRSRLSLVARFESLLAMKSAAAPPGPAAAGSAESGRLIRALRMSRTEVEYAAGFLLGVNACLFGALTAGLFVSAYYYPTIWLLVALGLTGRIYGERLLTAIDELAASPELHKRYAPPAAAPATEMM